jgi:uncharacterized protein YdbL (DUF1318 family)
MRRIVNFILRVLRRVAFLLIFVVLIIGSNILLLTADAVYDVAKRGLWSLVSVVADVAPPTTHRRNREVRARLTAQTDVFEAEAQRLDADLGRAQNEVGELTTERTRLNGRIARLNGRIVVLEQLDRPTREIVSEINERLARRTSRMIATNMSSMAIEALPYAGAAAIVGITFVEVRDACLTLADTREMSQLISGEPEAEVPACGYSLAEFWGVLSGELDEISCRDLSANMPAELLLDCSTIRREGELAPPNSDGRPELEDLRRPGE